MRFVYFEFLKQVTMVDGLRLLVVESLQHGEKETVARIDESTKVNVQKIEAATKQLNQQIQKTNQLEKELQKFKTKGNQKNVKEKKKNCFHRIIITKSKMLV